MAGVSRLRSAPWMLVLQAGFVASQHWRRLAPRERQRVLDLIRKGRGRPGNLTARERNELKSLAAKLDVKGMGKELMPIAGRSRKRR
jgi:hypothetical protein